MLLLIDRVLSKIARCYRKAVFKKKIGCKHSAFCLVGRVTVINKNVVIGKNVMIYPDVMLCGDGLIEIGDNVSIGNGTVIYSSKAGGVKIGNNVMIAAQSYIIDSNHGTAAGELMCRQSLQCSPVVIEDDVWLAAGVKILPGVKIHQGAVIGAQAVVNREVPSNAIAVGVPAKVIKYRE